MSTGKNCISTFLQLKDRPKISGDSKFDYEGERGEEEREGRRGERGERERGERDREERDREVTYVHIVNTLPATISKLATRLSDWYHRNSENNYQTLYYRDAEVFSLSHELIQCPCKQLGLFIISHALIARQ